MSPRVHMRISLGGLHLIVEFLNCMSCTFSFFFERIKWLSKVALRKLTNVSRPQLLCLDNMGNTLPDCPED